MGIFRKSKVVDVLFVGCDGGDLDRGIYSFFIDVSNGQLHRKVFNKSLANPISICKNGRFMNITYRNGSGRASDGGIWQYASMDERLGLTERVSNEGKTYVKTITNEERTYCYGIDYYNGEIVTVNIGKRSGKIAAVKDTIKLTGHSIDPIKQSESHPTDILFTPLEEKVVVLDLGGDEVILYDETKINEEGHIRLVKDEEHSFKLKEGSGPKKMVFSPDGRYAYLINEISSMINVYTYEHGIFTQVQELLSYSPEEFSGDNTPTDIVISSNNKYLFVTNKGDDTVVVFAIDQENGTIKRVDCIETDEGPRCMWLFRDKWLVVAARTGGSLETFEIKEDERKGIIYETHQQYTLHGPVCMQAGNANLKVLL